jgi:hypothetical protein
MAKLSGAAGPNDQADRAAAEYSNNHTKLASAAPVERLVRQALPRHGKHGDKP